MQWDKHGNVWTDPCIHDLLEESRWAQCHEVLFHWLKNTIKRGWEGDHSRSWVSKVEREKTETLLGLLIFRKRDRERERKQPLLTACFWWGRYRERIEREIDERKWEREEWRKLKTAFNGSSHSRAARGRKLVPPWAKLQCETPNIYVLNEPWLC